LNGSRYDVKDEPMDALNRGLNPNIWFGNVERVVFRVDRRETVQYVSHICRRSA
jgi:hypothetical protein